MPDTIRLPAPPPDTVTITRDVAPPLPTGTATSMCLATGETIQVLVTAQGDTLVGPARTSIRALRQAGVVFAGDYAQGRAWFEQDQQITFEEVSYQKSGVVSRYLCKRGWGVRGGWTARERKRKLLVNVHHHMNPGSPGLRQQVRNRKGASSWKRWLKLSGPRKMSYGRI